MQQAKKLPLNAQCSQVENGAYSRHSLHVVEQFAAEHAHCPRVGKKFSHLKGRAMSL